ncbi:MAG: ATP-binding protein, partial [bacterium]|nr:ATP-binding protein [bacterium]
VPRPDEQGIAKALDDSILRYKRTVNEDDRASMHRLAVGLTCRQVENIVAEGDVRPEVLGARRKELIRRDYGDHLEFFEPRWDLSDVGGSSEAVAELLLIAEAFKRGDRDVPSGIILAGQNGIGKTFLAKAFLGTLKRLTGVELRSPFDSLLGASERNWERVATALRSAGQVGVLVDEADAVMGNRSGPNVHEVSKRLFAQQMKLMGDEAYRGKIFWILMTCRPDKLAPDVKRPGRCERVIPLFPVASNGDATTMLQAVQRLLVREGYRFKSDIWAEIEIYRRLIGMTGAQIQRLLRRAKRYAGETEIATAHIERVLDGGKAFDATPEAGELQRLIAIIEAVETENDDLIPPYYNDEVQSKYAGIDGVRERIEVLRARLDR